MSLSIERLDQIRKHVREDDPTEASEDRDDLLEELDRLKGIVGRTLALAEATSDPGGDCSYGAVTTSLEDVERPGSLDAWIQSCGPYPDERVTAVLERLAGGER